MGWQKKSGVFPTCVRKPQHSVETLEHLAKGLNRSIVGATGGENNEDAIVQQTWERR